MNPRGLPGGGGDALCRPLHQRITSMAYRFDLNPLVSVGPIRFGEPIGRVVRKHRLVKRGKPFEQANWVTFEFPDCETRVYSVDGLVTSVGCYDNCIYKGKDLFGMTLSELRNHLGKETLIDELRGKGAAVEYEELDILVWLDEEDGRVDSVNCSGPMPSVGLGRSVIRWVLSKAGGVADCLKRLGRLILVGRDAEVSDDDDDNVIWEFHSRNPIKTYSNGAAAGDKVRIIKEIVSRDWDGNPTGEVYPCGEVWTVLTADPQESDIIWLRQTKGHRCTWDTDVFFETFEKVGEEMS